MSIFAMRAFRRRRHPFTWKRRWRLLVLDWLGREEPPERVAAAIALGVGIGFSPFLGFHIWIALGLAWLFRLNKIDAALGQFVGNPWTLPPVYAAGYRLGLWLLGYHRGRVPRLNWSALHEGDLTWILHPLETAQAVIGRHAFWPRLFAFGVGTTVLAVLIAFAAFFATRSVLVLFHRRHPRVAERAARRRAAFSRRRQRRATRAGG
jgi:uncharacterized protein